MFLSLNFLLIGGIHYINQLQLIFYQSTQQFMSSMLTPLGIMTAAFALFSLLIFLMKYNTELIKVKNKGLDRL